MSIDWTDPKIAAAIEEYQERERPRIAEVDDFLIVPCKLLVNSDTGALKGISPPENLVLSDWMWFTKITASVFNHMGADKECSHE